MNQTKQLRDDTQANKLFVCRFLQIKRIHVTALVHCKEEIIMNETSHVVCIKQKA